MYVDFEISRVDVNYLQTEVNVISVMYQVKCLWQLKVVICGKYKNLNKITKN